MAERLRRDKDRVDAMMASIYPVTREALKTGEIERAQDEIADAIVAMPQRPARAKRWPWLGRPRHVLLVGAVLVGPGEGENRPACAGPARRWAPDRIACAGPARRWAPDVRNIPPT